MSNNDRIVVAAVIAVFGVKGQVKIRSFTRPVSNLETMSELQVGGHKIMSLRPHTGGYVATLENMSDRDLAAGLIGETISIDAAALPPAGEGEYYWSDLVGCKVSCEDGSVLGDVSEVLENGAQDILVIEGEKRHMVPFVQGPLVKSVDVEKKEILVAWSAEY